MNLKNPKTTQVSLWRLANPGCRKLEYQRAKAQGKPRDRHLKLFYGISLSEYNDLVDAQKGLCAICGQPPSDKDKGVLHVDHSHDTGKVRGLLCTSCNQGLGRFSDDASKLRAAAKYLEEHER